METLVADKMFLPHRHLQVFWGKSGDFWQLLWDKFIDFAGNYRRVFARIVCTKFLAQVMMSST